MLEQRDKNEADINYNLRVVEDLQDEISIAEGLIGQSFGPQERGEEELRNRVDEIKAMEKVAKIFLSRIQERCEEIKSEMDREKTYQWGMGLVSKKYKVEGMRDKEI